MNGSIGLRMITTESFHSICARTRRTDNMLFEEICKCRIIFSADNIPQDPIEFEAKLLDADDQARVELFDAQWCNDEGLDWRIEVLVEDVKKWYDLKHIIRCAIVILAAEYMDIQEDNNGQKIIYTDLKTDDKGNLIPLT